jgi:hypothetical protein
MIPYTIAIAGMILLSIVYKRDSRLHVWPRDSHQQYMRETRRAIAKMVDTLTK